MQAVQRLKGLIALGMVFTLVLTPFNASAAAQKNDGVKENIRVITSTTSSNYKDLEFLKPILKDKTVVSLGENFHRVAEYSSMKTR
ncbi:hypothetical protein AZ66_18855, partial [Paenibacillus sp. E194]